MTKSSTSYKSNGSVVTHTNDDGSSTTNTVDRSGRITDIAETDTNGDTKHYEVDRDIFGPSRGSEKK